MVTLSAPHEDMRGLFVRLYCKNTLQAHVQMPEISQISYSITNQQGAVRGMHFQKAPYQEVKMVRCLRGKAWDVAVDIREGSATRYKWHAEELSAQNNKMMILSEGFAHGFQALEPNTELLYFITTPYNPEAEAGLNPLDPALEIPWPLEVTNLSKRDQQQPYLVT